MRCPPEGFLMLPCLGQKNVSLSPSSSSLPLCLPPSFAAPTRAPSSTPIRWLYALSYLLNSTAQETSHPHFPVSSHPTPLGLPQTSQKRPTNHTQHNQRKPCRCSSQHTQGSPQGRACADFSAYLLAFCPWAATCLPRGNPMGSCHAGTEGREGALC